MAKTKKVNYSAFVGLQKTLKQLLILWGPALVAMLVALQDNLPVEYAAWGVGLGFVAKFLENAYKYKFTQ